MVKNLAKYQSLLPIYKYIKEKDKLPVKVVEKFNNYNKTSTSRVILRNRFNFATSRFNTELGKKHSYRNTAFWNSLPQDLKVINTVDKFKTKLKRYLINN